MTKTKPKAAAERVVLYARISEDSTGEGAGVARQIEDMRALADVRGWEVVDVQRDDSISAWKGANRPGYQRVIEMVEARAVDRVVVWHMSRLWRSRPERAADQQKFATAGVSIAAVRGPELDLTTATGRMIVGVLGEFDSYESDVKAERVARASEQRAHEGRANGATPYGYRKVDPKVPGVLEPDPVLGPEVAGIVRHLLDGWSLRRVADDLNARRVPTPGRSKTWTPSSVRKVAVRPGNAGLRVFRGEVIGQASWPAVIGEDEFARLSATLADPARKTNRGNESERKHLLTYGLGACGICEGRLRVARKGKKRVPLYVCERGCIGRQVERVDDLVRAVVLARLARPDAADLLDVVPREPDSAADVDVDDLRERQAAAARAYAAKALTLEQLVEITSSITEQITAAEALPKTGGTVRGDRSQVARMLSVNDPAALWDRRMTVADRRAACEWLFDAVRIMPQRRGPGFVPESVVFVPRGSA